MKRVGAVTIACAAFALGASVAGAELTASGDLFVRFSGGISPNALPRHARAPISVHVAGTVRTLSGARPPALRRISIAINRGGRLDTKGLPTCRRAQIEPSTTAAALRACGAALVGGGRYTAAIAFPEQASFPTRGKILAFNTVIDGKRAILAHIYGTKPVPITRLIVFHIHQSKGAFGTVLTGSLPASTNRYGYVTKISLATSPTAAAGTATSAPPATRPRAFPAPSSPSPAPRCPSPTAAASPRP
jgi:hypothetical protein